MTHRELHITIPLMDELDHLPALLHHLGMQEHTDFRLVFCINQPDAWWEDKEHVAVCERNMESFDLIRSKADFSYTIIDRASKGKGWQGKQLGVGWARKVAMDAAAAEAAEEHIIITLDGDTTFSPRYFSSIVENFNRHADAVGLSVPYYHCLTGSDPEDRAILRYEIYMRHYAINMWRIGNPYRFTALGSAMALPVRSYRAIGGMTPKKSGEDFYFLQKLVKYGRLLTWNPEKVYPAARFSDRVFFGTGPAMIKGDAGDWDSYPVYHHRLFDDVKDTYDSFPQLFDADIPLPMDEFFGLQLGWNNSWEPLRVNNRSADGFSRACRDKVDGLRILQYLKHRQREEAFRDESCLIEFFKIFHPAIMQKYGFLCEGFTFDNASVNELAAIRDELAGIEEAYQKTAHGK